MSEGKLKNQFREYVDFISVSSAEKILDEAKKDFPKVENVTRATPEGEFNFFIYDTNKIDSWYKKWFGEPK